LTTVSESIFDNCTQAAEKALKAARYMKHYERLMSHDLPVIAYSLDSQLHDWARDLQLTSRRAEAMRYPDYWSRSSIPHTEYDSVKAQQTKELARKIVEHVRSLVDR